MSTDVKITYVNKSMNPDKPSVFIFTKNYVPTFDVLKESVAWRVLHNVGKGSSSEFVHPAKTTVQAMWGDGNKTQMLTAEIGKRYSVEEDNTGIVLVPRGNALDKKAIEVNSTVTVSGGISAALCKDSKVLVTKKIVAYDQTAVFVLHPKLYWGIASEIEEGQVISSAVLYTDQFFEWDIEGVSGATVVLKGDPETGYNFYVEKQI
jgi:hypothetical protein